MVSINTSFHTTDYPGSNTIPQVKGLRIGSVIVNVDHSFHWHYYWLQCYYWLQYCHV